MRCSTGAGFPAAFLAILLSLRLSIQGCSYRLRRLLLSQATLMGRPRPEMESTAGEEHRRRIEVRKEGGRSRSAAEQVGVEERKKESPAKAWLWRQNLASMPARLQSLFCKYSGRHRNARERAFRQNTHSIFEKGRFPMPHPVIF